MTDPAQEILDLGGIETLSPGYVRPRKHRTVNEREAAILHSKGIINIPEFKSDEEEAEWFKENLGEEAKK